MWTTYRYIHTHNFFVCMIYVHGARLAHPSSAIAVLHVVELIRFQMMLCICNRALVVNIGHVFIRYKLYQMWTVGRNSMHR